MTSETLDVLRAQLSNASAPERVRAAWEIALRLGGDATRELKERLGADKSAGARRHLVVVLAGLGERDALRVIAEHDVSPHVRATATAMVARTSPHAVARDAWLVERLRDPAIEVTRAAVDMAVDAPEPALARAIEALLDHEMPEKRSIALGYFEERDASAPAAVFRRALEEPDEPLRERFAWLGLRRAPGSVPALDPKMVRRLWNGTHASTIAIPWLVVARLATERDADRLLDVLAWEDIPLSALLALLARRRWLVASDAMDAVIARCETATRGADDRAHLATMALALEP